MTTERRPSDPRADALRRRYCDTFGVPDTIPVPVEAIATDLLGLWVEEVPDLPVSGALIPDERLVLVNRDEPPERRRFTLAHELGHWVCQCDEGRTPLATILCRGADMAEGAGRALETEANDFAATLLMPAAHLARHANRPEATAAQLGVSVLAVRWRSFNLGFGAAPGRATTGEPDLKPDAKGAT